MIQLYIDIDDNYKRIKYINRPYTSLIYIDLLNSVKDHIPLIDDYAKTIALDGDRQNPFNCNYIVGNTDNCIQKIINFIQMLGKLSLHNERIELDREKRKLNREREELDREREELNRERGDFIIERLNLNIEGELYRERGDFIIERLNLDQ
jgi:hypothetical protein